MYNEITWNNADDSDDQSISNFFSEVNHFKNLNLI